MSVPESITDHICPQISSLTDHRYASEQADTQRCQLPSEVPVEIDETPKGSGRVDKTIIVGIIFVAIGLIVAIWMSSSSVAAHDGGDNLDFDVKKSIATTTVVVAPAVVNGEVASKVDTSPTQGNEGAQVDAHGKYHQEPHGHANASELRTQEEISRDVRERIRQIDENTIQIGDVTLHKKERRLSFPVQIAERDRQLEYLVVHENGKTHESLLMTKVSAYDLHIASLLLKRSDSSPVIEVAIPRNGGMRILKIDQLIEVRGGASGMLSGDHWSYTGSSFNRNGFTAAVEGSYISLIEDTSALIKHSKTSTLGREDYMGPRKKSLPPEGLNLTLYITFP